MAPVGPQPEMITSNIGVAFRECRVGEALPATPTSIARS
jgi:hypothetical protein